jgi:hypothetical protein
MTFGPSTVSENLIVLRPLLGISAGKNGRVELFRVSFHFFLFWVRNLSLSERLEYVSSLDLTFLGEW